MQELAEKSATGSLTSFAGIFGVTELEETEKSKLSAILEKYPPVEQTDSAADLSSLIALSSEVKAINNQAAILHGERIKKAQAILKKYRDGAFTAWLLATYGNRQTPYNFLQYYDFFNEMPKELHRKIENMPRQAIYTLASRDGELTQKETFVKNYQGETKEELLTQIRSLFPLPDQDKRKENMARSCLLSLERMLFIFKERKIAWDKEEKEAMLTLLQELMLCLKEK